MKIEKNKSVCVAHFLTFLLFIMHKRNDTTLTLYAQNMKILNASDTCQVLPLTLFFLCVSLEISFDLSFLNDFPQQLKKTKNESILVTRNKHQTNN